MSDPDGDEPMDGGLPDGDVDSEADVNDDGVNDWEDDEEEMDEEPTKSLFSDKVLASPEAALQYDAQHHGFDLRQFALKVRCRALDVVLLALIAIYRALRVLRTSPPATPATGSAGARPSGRRKRAAADRRPLCSVSPSHRRSWTSMR